MKKVTEKKETKKKEKMEEDCGGMKPIVIKPLKEATTKKTKDTKKTK